MPNKYNHFPLYTAVLEPWTRLAMNAPSVINMRLMQMPWLWISDPQQASREVQQMFTEKNDAWQETVVAMTQAPMYASLDFFQACFSPRPHLAMAEAMIKSSRRIARPSNSRVSANNRRLRKN